MSDSSSVEIAPPPWTCKTEVYWMFIKDPTGSDGKLLPGTYDPLELPGPHFSDPRAANPKFMGGMPPGMVWVVRYHDSPVGPYDELLIIPGNFEAPDGTPHPRITRLYVSVPDAVSEGRKYWNIPKHLARFTFTSLPNNKTMVEVFDYPGRPQAPDIDPEGSAPFFAAVFYPQRFLPAIPFNMAWFGVPSMPLPPLPKGPHVEEVSTEQWGQFSTVGKGKVKITWWEPAPPRPDAKVQRIKPGQYGDGIGFPEIKVRNWGLGFQPGSVFWFSDSKPVKGA